MSTNLEFTDGGVWIRYREGRSRFFLAGSTVYERARAGLALDGLDAQRRACASGTHEPIVGYRNTLTGEWSIPPEPGIVPAEASDPRYERRELRTLADADRASAEMRSHLARQFDGSGDRQFTEHVDDAMGSPLEMLREQARHPKSQMEKDVIGLLLTELDREARDREHVSTELYFHRREFDR